MKLVIHNSNGTLVLPVCIHIVGRILNFKVVITEGQIISVLKLKSIKQDSYDRLRSPMPEEGEP
jgi:hypothetical protein